jgi:hypothetical protein
MDFPLSARKATKMKCEICGNREAVHSGLCENCAEGITRLARIKLPERYLTAVVSDAVPSGANIRH